MASQKSMMTVAYIIGSNTIRFLNLDKNQTSSKWLDNALDPFSWTEETIKKRCEDVFNLTWGKFKSVVLVNAVQLPIEYVQIAVNIASKYSDEVCLISPLMARMMFAISETKLKLSLPSEKALIACFIKEYSEIYEIEVISDTCYGFVNSKKCSRENAKEFLLSQINETSPSAVILLSTQNITPIKIWLEESYNGIIHSLIERRDYMILSGALAKTAALFPDSFDPPMDILNFANGFNVEYFYGYGREEIVLIPFGEELPTEAKIELPDIKSFSIRHNEELISVTSLDSRTKPICKREKTKIYETNKPGNYKITASINKYGVPYLNVDRQIDLEFLKNNHSLFNENKVSFAIKLKENYGSICCKYNDKEIIIKNANSKLLNFLMLGFLDNEWTPLYISFLNSKVVVGEKAIQDFMKKPEYVVADIHKIIGIPFDEIKFNPKWKFNLAPDAETQMFATYELETFEGPRRISPHFVMTLLLTAIKRIAEQELDIEIKNLNIQLSNAYSKEQMNEIKKAAESSGIDINNIECVEL